MINIEDEIKLGELYNRINEEKGFLSLEEVDFLDNRLETYYEEINLHANNNTIPDKSREDYLIAEINTLITIMDAHTGRVTAPLKRLFR